MSSTSVATTAATAGLPPGWASCRIMDAGIVQLGRQRSPSHQSDRYPTPYVRAANITWQGLNLDDVLEMEFTPAERTTYQLKPGDVLLSEASGSPSEVGKPVVWNGELPLCCFQNTVIRFRPIALVPQFALWLFSHLARSSVFANASRGVGIHHLGAQRFEVLPIPVPPLAEQARIADRLDELFTDLAAGVVALDRVKRNLSRYRAAVLHAAVMGRLTQSASAVWASHEKWRQLGEVIGRIEQGWSPKCEREPASSDAEWAVMTTTAIQKLAFDGRENKRLPSALDPAPQYEVQVGDMLITRAGPRSRCGVACFVRQTRPRLMLCDKAYRFRCNESEAIPEYLEIVLNARPITDAIERMKTGSSDSGLNLTQSRFRLLRLPVPPKPEQAAIADVVNEKLSQIDALEAEVNHGLARASRLRQSILKAAFEGKLVPQDPADEPARVLLERIRAQSADAPKTKRSPRKPASRKPARKIITSK